MTTVAVIQLISNEDVEDNLKQIESLIDKAVNQGARLIILPENACFMGDEFQKVSIAEALGNGPIQKAIALMAKKHQCWILVGSLPIQTVQGMRVKQTSILFDSSGEIAIHYDKIHLFDVKVSEQEAHQESRVTSPGCELVTASTPYGTIGLSICYDLRFPELYRALVERGAQLISVPSAFTEVTGRAHWECLLRARAIENQVYVLAANQGGVHQNGRQTYGHSMIVSPWGEILAQCDKGPGVILADIDLRRQDQIRQDFPVLKHRVINRKNK